MGLEDEIVRQQDQELRKAAGAESELDRARKRCAEFLALVRRDGIPASGHYFTETSTAESFGLLRRTKGIVHRFDYLGCYWSVTSDETHTLAVSETGEPISLGSASTTESKTVDWVRKVTFDAKTTAVMGREPRGGTAAVIDTRPIAIPDYFFSEANLASAFRSLSERRDWT
jgi:hypothetical protein